MISHPRNRHTGFRGTTPCLKCRAAWMLAVALALPAAASGPGEGSAAAAFQGLLSHFERPDLDFAPFFFWFWDQPLDETGMPGRIADTAESMLSQGFNPGYVHARMNMAGLPDLPLEQWLGEPWFDAFGAALERTGMLGGRIGYCDDYWWPSGRAGDRVLEAVPDLWAVSLYWSVREVPGSDTVHLPESFFTAAARLVSKPIPACATPMRDPGFMLSGAFDPAPHIPAVISGKSLRLIGEGGKFVWRAPAGGYWRVYSFFKYYHPGADGGRVNYLDRRLAPVFIRLAHEPYERRYRDFFGKTLAGVFMDHEGDYGYKLAWSDDLAAHYSRKFSRDIRETMPLLVDRDEEGGYPAARWKWFDAVSDLYAEFFRTCNRWLAGRGLTCVSNLWEETLMWQAGAVGDFFKVQRAFTLPGTDCLCLKIMQPHDLMETRSICAFENRRFQCEIMGGSGLWGFSPSTLKQAANAAAAWGVSHVVPHAVFLTRRLEGNPWLPDWYDGQPFWPVMHCWSGFTARASFINGLSRPVPQVLLFNPMDSVWGLCGPGVFDPAFRDRVPVPALMPLPGPGDIPRSLDEMKRQSAWWTPPLMNGWFDETVLRIDTLYAACMAGLSQRRIEYLIADRHYLSLMTAGGGELRKPPFAFNTLVLPGTLVLPEKALERALAFAESGGHVLILDRIPEASAERGFGDAGFRRRVKRLMSRPSVRFISGSIPEIVEAAFSDLEPDPVFSSGGFDLLQQRRSVAGLDFFWLANNTGVKQHADLLFRSERGRILLWDCEHGTVRPVPSVPLAEGSTVSLDFDEYEGFWLSFDPAAPPLRPESGTAGRLAEIPVAGPWRIRIDPSAQPRLEHPFPVPSALQAGITDSLRQWKDWGLEGFSGCVDYETVVVLDDTSGIFGLDAGKVLYAMRAQVNGVSAGDRLWPPHVLPVRGLLKRGENRITLRIYSLINNSFGDHRDSGLQGPVRLCAEARP